MLVRIPPTRRKNQRENLCARIKRRFELSSTRGIRLSLIDRISIACQVQVVLTL